MRNNVGTNEHHVPAMSSGALFSNLYPTNYLKLAPLLVMDHSGFYPGPYNNRYHHQQPTTKPGAGLVPSDDVTPTTSVRPYGGTIISVTPPPLSPLATNSHGHPSEAYRRAHPCYPPHSPGPYSASTSSRSVFPNPAGLTPPRVPAPLWTTQHLQNHYRPHPTHQDGPSTSAPSPPLVIFGSPFVATSKPPALTLDMDGVQARPPEMPVFHQLEVSHQGAVETGSTGRRKSNSSHRKGRLRSNGPLSTHAVYARLNRERRKKYLAELEVYRNMMKKRQVAAQEELAKILAETKALTEEVAGLRGVLQKNTALMDLLTGGDRRNPAVEPRDTG